MSMVSCQISETSNAEKKSKKSRKRFEHGNDFMWINAQIIAHSQQGSTVDELVFTISKHLHNMNLVNLTTSIHRLGKMVANDWRAQTYLKQLPILSKLLTPIARVLSTTHTKNIQPQSISNIVWALATIRVVDAHVVFCVCQHALPNIDRFKPFELATLLWALAKLCTIECASALDMVMMRQIFDAAGRYVVQHVRSIECRCLSMVVWAFATVKQQNEELFSEVASQIANGPTPTCQEMANTIWAYGTNGIMNRDLFKSLAQKAVRHLGEFKAQELSNMVWGFASAGFFHEEFFQQAATSALSKDLSTQHLANILWAFTRVRPRHHLTQRVVLSFLPLCCQRMTNFKAQEISSLALSVAKAFTLPEAEKPCHLPQPVVQFFRIVSKTHRDLADFSTQSLINMASAFAMMKLFDDELFLKLGQETVERSPFMEAADLLRIFQVYLSARTVNVDCANMAGLLVSPLARRLNNLQPREIKALTHSCSDFLRSTNRQDLLEQCAQMMDVASATDRKLEDASGAETDEPKGSVSELSDSAEEEDAEHTWSALGTQHLNQQGVYEHSLAFPPPRVENFSMDYFYWPEPSQQKSFQIDQGIAWAADQGYNPIEWAPVVHAASAESIFVPPTKLVLTSPPPPSCLLWNVDEELLQPPPPASALLWNVGEELLQPPPPASSLLWNMDHGRDTFSAPESSSLEEAKVVDRAYGGDQSSLVAELLAKAVLGDRNALAHQAREDSEKMSEVCMESLQNEERDSTKVVVKNTFIEYQHARPEGVSAIQFCSEKLHCRR